MTILEKDICFMILKDKMMFEDCKCKWDELNRLYPSEDSVAFELFYDYLDIQIYKLFVECTFPKCLNNFVYDLLDFLDFEAIGDFLVDFF